MASRRLQLLPLAALVAGCRLGVPSLPKVESWTPGARAIVMPMRGSTPTDDQVAAVVADRLRQLGDVDLLAPAPSAMPVSNGDPRYACQQAHDLGADYVVLTSGDISILDNKLCLVGTGILSQIVLPLPIPVPIPIVNKVAVVEVPLSLPDKCIFSVEIGDKWSVSANAQVFSTAQCLATGGQFAIERGTSLTLNDGAALQRAIENKTADLFPARATIRDLDGESGIVVAPKGLKPGDVYEVRGAPHVQGSLGYVRRVDRDRAVIEPFEPTDRLQRGDLLLRRGTPLWMEFLAYGASSQLSVGGDRHLASGGGGLFRGQFGWFSIGLDVEYLRILDADVRRATDTTSTLKGGLQGGLHHHFGPRLDLYLLAELGYMDALGISSEGDDRVGYAAGFVGARTTLGKWFASLELGAIGSGMQEFDTHATVGQRAAAGRLTLGRNFRLGPML